MGKHEQDPPYDRASRNRNGTHVSRIIKLHVIDPVIHLIEDMFRPDSGSHPTIKVPTNQHRIIRIPPPPPADRSGPNAKTLSQRHATIRASAREPSSPTEVEGCEHKVDGSWFCLKCGEEISKEWPL